MKEKQEHAATTPLPTVEAEDLPVSAFPLADSDAARLLRSAIPSNTCRTPRQFFSSLGVRDLHVSDTSRVTVAVLDGGEEVALKRVRMRDDPVLQSYVFMEVAMSVLHSPLPQVVGLRGVMLDGEEVWLVMELMHHGSLADIRQQAEMPERAIAHAIRQVLLAVVDMHARDRIHRDLKGQNILVNSDGEVKVTDFGWAMQRTQSHRTTSVAVGSVYWMAPEVHAERDYDEKADIWSVGITAFELATGEPPFFDLDEDDAIANILAEPTPPLPTALCVPGTNKLRAVEWSDDLKDFVAACTRRHPSARPSAAELLDHPFVQSAMSLEEWRAFLGGLRLA